MYRPILIILLVLSIPFAVAAAEPDGESGRAFYELGVFAFNDGDYADAEANFQKASSLDPKNPYYHHYLGKTLMKLERYAEAARHLDLALKDNALIPGLKYDRAMLCYQTSEYARAAADFSALSRREPDNINALFYAGLSHFQLRRHAEAVGFFDAAAEKALAIKPAAWLYAGICEAKTGNQKSAASRFAFVRDNADSETLRKTAQRWLDALDRTGKTAKPYRLLLSLGAEYDDNVRLEPLDEDIYADEGDFLAKVYLSGSYALINRDIFKFGAGYSHYQTWHHDLTEYDLMGAIGNVFTRYSLGDVSFGLSWLPSYYSLDGEAYLTRHQFKPDITWKADPGAFASFSYTWSQNDYEANENDGHTHEALFNFYYVFGDPGEYVMWGLGYEANASDNQAKEYSQLKTKLDVVFRLPFAIELGLTGKYANRRYDHRYQNIVPEFHRKDIKYFGAITLSHRLFFDWLAIVGQGSFTRNDSNVKQYDYQKNTGTVSLEAKF